MENREVRGVWASEFVSYAMFERMESIPDYDSVIEIIEAPEIKPLLISMYLVGHPFLESSRTHENWGIRY